MRDRWFLQDRLRIPVRSRSGKSGELSASRLPSPLHLLPSFLAYPHLSKVDKLRTLYGMLRAKFADRRAPDLEETTFYQWLRRNCQSEQAIRNLWNLVVEPTLNDDVSDVSAAMGLMIVQEGMLSGVGSGNLGYATGGLLPSLGAPAREALRDRGAELLLGETVRSISLGTDPQSPRSSPGVNYVELGSGRRICGRAFVSALPFSVLPGILPKPADGQEFFANLGQLQWSPILNLHIHYDRPVMSEPFCAFVDSPLQWVFDHSRITGITPVSGGQVITVSVSAAWERIDLPREELTRRFTAEVAEVFPEARRAEVLSVSVVRQREATFRCLPGASRLRPGAATPISNFFLAGEWTNTGWPSTMEGAVRSGYAAARAVIERAGLEVNAETA